MTTYLPYTLTVQSPLLITGVGGDANGAQTMHFVPGSAMRGVIANRIGDPDRHPEVREQFERLVLSGDVAYLPAYPMLEGTRAIPAPRSWRRDKYSTATFDIHAREDGVPIGRQAAEFFAPARQTGEWVGVHVQVTSRTHQLRDRAVGFPNAGVGAIFTYEAMDAGQSFAGIIRCRSSGNVAEVRELLRDGETLLFGRSRRAAYGGEATLTWGEARSFEIAPDFGLVRRGGTIPAGSRLRLLLLSPYIGRDRVSGQLDPAVLRDELTRRACGTLAVDAMTAAYTVVRGYNRKWRLRTPEALAMDAGSVIELTARCDIEDGVAASIEDEGLGERRVEGFGRVLFVEREAPVFGTHAPELTRTAQSDTTAEATPLLMLMQERIVLARIDRQIDIVAATYSDGAFRPPTTTLLGRLLLPLRRNPHEGLETLGVWIGGRSEAPPLLRRPALDQLDRCVITTASGRVSLTHLLRSFIRLPLHELPLPVHAIAAEARLGTEADARRALEAASETIRARLIVALLRRLMKTVAGGDDA